MVGAGFISQVGHLANFIQLSGCELRAVADPRSELAAQVAERYRIPQVFNSHHELLQQADVDAVVVVTHRQYTAEIVLECLLAGKHTLSEKPMASTLAQAESLLKVAEAQAVTYQIGYMKRHDVGVIRTRDEVRNWRSGRRFGGLTYVRAHSFGGDSYCKIDGDIQSNEPKPGNPPLNASAPEWLAAKYHGEYSKYINNYCHDINLLRFLLDGEPVVNYSDVACSKAQQAILEFQGVRCILETGTSTNRHWDEVVEFYFEGGRIRLALPPPFLRNVPARLEIYDNHTMETRVPNLGWSWSFKRQAEAFVDAIRKGSPDISSAKSAIEDLRVAEKIWQSVSVRNG
jgi:predicted dehydrogenase